MSSSMGRKSERDNTELEAGFLDLFTSFVLHNVAIYGPYGLYRKQLALDSCTDEPMRTRANSCTSMVTISVKKNMGERSSDKSKDISMSCTDTCLSTFTLAVGPWGNNHPFPIHVVDSCPLLQH